MPIVINEPIVLTESQKKKFHSVYIEKLSDTVLMAKIIFHVVCPNTNAFIKEEILTYTGEDYDNFWKDFNNGKFLYEQIADDEVIPEDIENEFLNNPVVE